MDKEIVKKEFTGITSVFREANKPEPVETLRNGRVKWGVDNLYPQFLNSLYYDNPIHQGIIDQKVKFITAAGCNLEGGNLNNGQSINDLNDLIEDVSYDNEIGATFCVLFQKRGNVWHFKSVGFELIRATEDGIYYEYSEDWSKAPSEKVGYRLIKSIHNLNDEDVECILVSIRKPKQRKFMDGKNRGLTASYYPVVGYSGSITDIMASIEMGYFTFAETVNGFKGGTFISLGNGVPTDDKKREIEREIKGTATDRDKQGGLGLGYHTGADTKPEVYQLNGNDLDKRYDQAKKTCRDSIMIGHGVISPALFGIVSESLFGSREELETSYVLFKRNYVKHQQDHVSKPISWSFRKLGISTGVIKFNDYKLFEDEISPVDPVQKFSAEDETANFLSHFDKVGISKSELKIIHSSEFDGQLTDEDFISNYRNEKFATDLTERQNQILALIDKRESYHAITTALDISGRTLSNEILKLGKSGYLDGWNVTPKGIEQTKTQKELSVFYSYELKPTAPPLVKGGKSREFCVEMLRRDKLYTRMEIDTISGLVKRDVWSYRGGWYHNPETDRNTPSCRHVWKQNIVIK